MMVKLNEYLQVNADCITRAVKVSYQMTVSEGAYVDLIHALDDSDSRKLRELYKPTRDGMCGYYCTDIKKVQEALPQLYSVTYVEGTSVCTVFATEDYCKKFLDMQPTDTSAKEGE